MQLRRVGKGAKRRAHHLSTVAGSRVGTLRFAHPVGCSTGFAATIRRLSHGTATNGVSNTCGSDVRSGLLRRCSSMKFTKAFTRAGRCLRLG